MTPQAPRPSSSRTSYLPNLNAGAPRRMISPAADPAGPRAIAATTSGGGAPHEVGPDGEPRELRRPHGAHGVLRRVHDGLLVHVEAGVHEARGPGQLVELGEHRVVRGVVLAREDLRP